MNWSLRLLGGTRQQFFFFFVSNKLKFMSCCLICLVTARDVFLSQPDSSAITNVHKPNFSLLLYN